MGKTVWGGGGGGRGGKPGGGRGIEGAMTAEVLTEVFTTIFLAQSALGEELISSSEISMSSPEDW